MKNMKIILLVILAITFFSYDLMACSCAPLKSPSESLQKSASVMAGRVTQIETVGNEDLRFPQKKVTVELSQIWKGAKNKMQVVYTNIHDAACGFDFREGGQYLIYSYEREGKLQTNICTRTRVLASAEEDLQALGAGEAPENVKLLMN